MRATAASDLTWRRGRPQGGLLQENGLETPM